MIKIIMELDSDTLALLMEVKKNLREMGDYESMDSVVRELCNVYFLRYE